MIKNKKPKLNIRRILTFSIALCLLITLFFKLTSTSVQAAWFDDSYAYRQRITFIHNANVSTETYVSFTISNTNTLVSNGKMQSSCADSRFTDQNGKILRYQLVSGCNSASTVYRVAFPANTIINGNNVIFIYYGNAIAVSASDSTVGNLSQTTPSGSVTSASEEKGLAPVAYWSLDEASGTTASDASPNRNTGTLSGATLPTWQTSDQCVSSNCLYFGGSTSYVTAANASSIQLTGALTLSAWTRPNTLSTNRTIVSKNGASGSYGYRLYTNSSGNAVFEVSSNGTATTSITGSSTLVANRWYKIVAVYVPSTSLSIYINGRQDGQNTSSIPASINGTTATLNIGSENAGASNRFQGYIDEVKIYNFAKSFAQIQTETATTATNTISAQLGSPNTGNTLSNGLVGYWKLDESSGNPADFSGNGNSLSNNNTTTFANGKFGYGSSHNGTNQYFSTATSISNVKTVAFWVYPASSTNNYANLASGVYVTSSSGTISATGFTSPIVYVNGVLNGTITASAWNNVVITTLTDITADAIEFGRANSSYLSNTSKLDELRLYNRALSAAEIADLYNWAPGPVGWWKLDENINNSSFKDSSGNGNNSSGYFGSPIPSFTVGKFGSALSFNGSNYASVTNAPAINLGKTTDSYTAQLWVKTKTSGGVVTFLNKVIGSNGTKEPYQIGYIPATNVAFFGINCNGSWEEVDSSTIINTGVWTHITGVRDIFAGKIYIYINGHLEASATDTCAVDTSSDGALVFGAGDSGGGWAFPGQLDDVRVYNYARTPKQINQDMNGDHPANGSPIASQTIYWNMDESNGSTLNNSNPTQSALTGTVTTGTWLAPSNCKINTCLSLTAQSSSLSAGDTSFTDSLSGFTTSLWLNPQTLTTDDSIVSKSTLSTQNSFLIRTDSSTPSEVRVYIASSTSDTSNYYTTSGLGLTASTWQNLSVVYDGSQPAANRVRVYRNGKLTNGSITGTIPTSMTAGSTSNLKLGDSDIAGSDGLIAYYDEFKIYASSLSTSEIQVDANANGAIALGGVLGAQNDEGFSLPGPVAWWKFDDRYSTTTKDSSGNSLNGTLTNGPTWDIGKIGTGLYFDGASNQYVEVSDNSALKPTTAISVSTWFKANNINGATRILSKKNSSGYRLALNTSTCTGETSHLCFLLRISGADQWAAYAVSNLASKTWYHVVGTYDGSIIKLYVNGILVDTTSVSGTIDQGTPNLCFGVEAGASTCSTNNAFTGWIDDTRIYSTALTQAQVAYLYNRGAPIAYYQFDDCQGTSTKDATGNNLHGTLTIGGTGTQSIAGDCNTASTAWGNGATGKYNSSLNFDGTDDYVSIANNSAFNPGDGSWSVFAWANPPNSNQSIRLVSKTSPSSPWAEWTLTICGSQNCASSGKKLYGTFIQDIGGSNIYRESLSTADVADGNWHLYGMVADKTNNKVVLYLDGNPISTTQFDSGAWPNVSNSQNVGIGADVTSGSMYYSGKIDDVRIYNYSLTSSQVKTIYNQGSAVRFGPLIGTP